LLAGRGRGGRGRARIMMASFGSSRSSGASRRSSAARLSRCRESLLYAEGDPDDIFRIRALCGEGSYGLVYLAEMAGANGAVDGPLEVAIKVVASSASAEKELRILRDLQHPNIVQYFGTWVKDGQLWIAMEFCEGGSVCDAMEKLRRGLRPPEIRAVAAAAVRGLAYLHGMNVMHRDIKGDNILLTASGAKLADFGVSTRLAGQSGRRGTMTGTPYWMAPEVCAEGSYDVTADTVRQRACVRGCGCSSTHGQTGACASTLLPAHVPVCPLPGLSVCITAPSRTTHARTRGPLPPLLCACARACD